PPPGRCGARTAHRALRPENRADGADPAARRRRGPGLLRGQPAEEDGQPLRQPPCPTSTEAPGTTRPATARVAGPWPSLPGPGDGSSCDSSKPLYGYHARWLAIHPPATRP